MASGTDSTLEKVVSDALGFLEPVLHTEKITTARGQNILARISTAFPSELSEAEDVGQAVILQALTYVKQINNELLKREPQPALKAGQQRCVDALFDLTSLEGIYPALLPGVGVPIERRIKSVLKGQVSMKTVAEQRQNASSGLLATVTEVLHEIAVASGGLVHALQDRILVDLLAAELQLCFAPDSGDRKSSKAEKLVSSSPTPALLHSLVSLNHAGAPSWLKLQVASQLSKLPMRNGAVLAAINFFARRMQRPHDYVSEGPSKLPLISQEVLEYCTKLFSSVPLEVDPLKFFEAIVPQLLVLLDDENSPDMVRTSSYIIDYGMLARRSVSAPGLPAYDLLVRPIMEAINPRYEPPVEGPEHHFSATMTTIDIGRALQRLSVLVLTHPNPGLLRRLVRPLYLPIWAIFCCAEPASLASVACLKLLRAYFSIEGDKTTVNEIRNNILCLRGYRISWSQSGQHWIKHPSKDEADPIVLAEEVGERVSKFVTLLDNITDDQTMLELFLDSIKKWLQPQARESSLRSSPSAQLNPAGYLEREHQMHQNFSAETTPEMNTLINAKLVQLLLERKRQLLASNPLQVVSLLHHLLVAEVNGRGSDSSPKNRPPTPSLISLGSIAPSMEDQEPGEDMIATYLSVLSTIMLSPEFVLDSATEGELNQLQTVLSSFTDRRLGFSQEIVDSAMNVWFHIKHLVSASPSSKADAKGLTADPHAGARQAQAVAFANISSDLPPVRADGLNSLTSLVKTNSPVLDIPSTTLLLISVLQDEDEFVYLKAIAAVTVLSERHSKTVLTHLIDAYVDPDEQSKLDVRLRIGESIRKVIESLGAAFAGELATKVGEALLYLASRRPTRMKAKRVHEDSSQTVHNENATRDSDKPDHEPNSAMERQVQDVLAGWQGKGGTEDLRIRTSALSLLSVAIETSIAGLGSRIVSTAIDVAIEILKRETAPSEAILRRAAVTIISSLLTALQNAKEERRALGVGLEGQAMEDVMQVLRILGSTDSDGIVRGHIERVLENLEEWHEDALFRQVQEQEPLFGIGGRLQGVSKPQSSGRILVEELDSS